MTGPFVGCGGAARARSGRGRGRSGDGSRDRSRATAPRRRRAGAPAGSSRRAIDHKVSPGRTRTVRMGGDVRCRDAATARSGRGSPDSRAHAVWVSVRPGRRRHGPESRPPRRGRRRRQPAPAGVRRWAGARVRGWPVRSRARPPRPSRHRASHAHRAHTSTTPAETSTRARSRGSVARDGGEDPGRSGQARWHDRAERRRPRHPDEQAAPAAATVPEKHRENPSFADCLHQSTSILRD